MHLPKREGFCRLLGIQCNILKEILLMKRYLLLLFVFFSCSSDIQKKISLADIDTEAIAESFECALVLKWSPHLVEATKSFINILKKDYNQEYTKIVLCQFSHSGETVSHNSLAIFHDLEGNMTVLSFGMDWKIIRKKIKTASLSTEKILSKLSNDGNFTQMNILDFTKDNTKCYFTRNFNHIDYERLQNLQFFNSP